MINFLKGYSYDIFKMFVNQLGMTMFGLVLSMATSRNDPLFIISSVFSIIFLTKCLLCQVYKKLRWH